MDHRGRRPRAPALGALPPGRRRPLGLSGRWRVRHERGGAELCARPWPDRPEPSAWVVDVTRPGLVLGSTQPASTAAPGTGVDVVRRHGGGGAVLVGPGRQVWIDVLVPAGDPLWERDVGRAFAWLGQAWAGALADAGVAGARPHTGAPVATPWSRLVCFAGLGPGEVSAGGAKVVGMSQRRRRDGALFQCAALLSWDPVELLDLLAVDAARRPAAARELATVAAGLPLAADVVAAALLERLARL